MHANTFSSMYNLPSVSDDHSKDRKRQNTISKRVSAGQRTSTHANMYETLIKLMRFEGLLIGFVLPCELKLTAAIKLGTQTKGLADMLA